jgi:hypothetical protein
VTSEGFLPVSSDQPIGTVSLPGPDRLLLVELLVLGGSLLDLLGLLGLLVVLILDLFNLVVSLLDLLVILDLLLGLLGDNELDGVRDELGLNVSFFPVCINERQSTYVLLDNLLDPLLLEVLLQVVLHEELHGGSSSETGTLSVLSDGECSTGSRLPDVLFVVIVLGGDLDLLGDEVGRVETNTELTYLLAHP